jgi:putative PEP-CTERM system TPR-repeat lipoprotein
MLNLKALYGGLLVLATLLAAGGCGQTQRTTDEEYLQKAKEYQAQGKLESAVIQLKNSLQKNPKNLEARLRLGEIYADLGFGDQAELELIRAKDLGTDAEALKILLGRALLLQGLYSRVLAEIYIGPKSPQENVPKILELQGRAQFGLRHFEDGCKLFEQAVEKDPRYIPAYWGLARCAAGRGRLDEARAELDKARTLEEKNSGTWTLLGDLERVTRRLPEAEVAYGYALKYKTDNLDALMGRAAIRIDNNKLAEASQDVDAAAKISGNHPAVNTLRGVIQFKQGKFAEAKTTFETALNTRPDYTPAVLWLGLTNFWQANYEQAARQFSQYLHDVPNATQVQALLALAQVRLGRGQEAEEILKALGNINIKDPQSLALIAQAHLSLGETDLAAIYLTKAVEQKPKAADLRVGLATTLSRKGKRAEAIEQLESAIQLDPTMITADVLLIRQLVQDRQFDKALQTVESLEKKQPQNPITFNLKGAVYLAKNDFANARKAFEQASALETSPASAALNLAKLDLLERKPDAARQRYQAVLAKDKTNLEAMMGLAAVAGSTGHESEYATWLETAAKVVPSAVQPRMLLANYYLKKNEVRKALATAQEIQTIDPDNTGALDLVGTAQLAGGEAQNAVTTYTKLARLNPKDPAVHYKLATAQAASQATSAARASLNKALALKPDHLPAEMLLASLELDRPADPSPVPQAHGRIWAARRHSHGAKAVCTGPKSLREGIGARSEWIAHGQGASSAQRRRQRRRG